MIRKKDLIRDCNSLQESVFNLQFLLSGKDEALRILRERRDALEAELEDTKTELRRFKIYAVGMSIIAVLCYAAFFFSPLL